MENVKKSIEKYIKNNDIYYNDFLENKKDYQGVLDYAKWELNIVELYDLCEYLEIPLYKEYNGGVYIELHSNRTLWEINKNIEPELYQLLAGEKFEEFKIRTGLNVYGLGRSGRHICIELTFKNILNYNKYKNVALELEQDFINEINEDIVI